jgi:hypothetical protein
MTTHKFEVGQLVKIRAGLEDKDLPPDRRVGLIVRKHTLTDLRAWTDAEADGLWDVNINGKTLRFNEEWMTPFTEED